MNQVVCSNCGGDVWIVLPVFRLSFNEQGQLSVEEWPLPRESLPASETRRRHIACSTCGWRMMADA